MQILVDEKLEPIIQYCAINDISFSAKSARSSKKPTEKNLTKQNFNHEFQAAYLALWHLQLHCSSTIVPYLLRCRAIT